VFKCEQRLGERRAIVVEMREKESGRQSQGEGTDQATYLPARLGGTLYLPLLSLRWEQMVEE